MAAPPAEKAFVLAALALALLVSPVRAVWTHGPWWGPLAVWAALVVGAASLAARGRS